MRNFGVSIEKWISIRQLGCCGRKISIVTSRNVHYHELLKRCALTSLQLNVLRLENTPSTVAIV